MLLRLDRAHRLPSVLLGLVALASAAALLIQDADPGLLPARTHDAIGAFSLASIAVAYLAYQALRRAAGAELVKSILLAAAFLFWAANQVWRNPRMATLCNDLAIALFVFDVFLVMAGWPSPAPDSSFAEALVCEDKEQS
jgi:hypothetical protein